MPFSNWRAHFEANVGRPLPEVTPPPLSAERHAALRHSLAVFQLGESGEGRIAHEVWKVELPGVDDDYRVALGLFVAEEGRHARVLGRALNALGASPLSRHWSEKIFVRVRRLLGFRLKLLVLMAAEVVGIGFYGLLGNALGTSPLASALAQLCADEEAHLKFHADFFRAQTVRPFSHLGLRLAWWALGTVGVAAVLVDHRHTLAAFGIPLRTAARALFGRVREGAARMRYLASSTTKSSRWTASSAS